MSSMRWTILSLILMVSMLVVTPFARGDSGLGRHKKMYAVPAPGAVTIDGKLDDWDLSAQIHMYVVSETADMQGARFALMYDNEALYISGVVRDKTPMMNRHNPVANGDWGWDADVCQFRMVLDPKHGHPAKGNTYSPREQNKNDQMVHMTMWHYTDTGEPVLQMQYGMAYDLPKAGYSPFGVIPADKFQAKYVKSDDGQGYTFEYRVSWKTLEANAPLKAGDLVAGTVQFNWGQADGLKTNGQWAYDVMAGQGFTFQNAACWGKILFSDKGNIPKELVEDGLPPEPVLPLTFGYDLPEDGEVTLSLVDQSNMIVRTIIASAPRMAGQNSERWSGLDDNGKPLPAGTYKWKGLYHKPITTKYLFSIGNSGTPGHKTDDNTGGWGGDHGWPTTTVALPDGGMLLFWHVSESGWGTVRTNADGKKMWGNKHNGLYAATDGKRYFVVGDFGYTGQDSVVVLDLKDGAPLPWGNGAPYLPAPPGGEAKNNVASGVAYHDGKVYVSWNMRDVVAVYDATSGSLLEQWNVPGPRMIAPRPDGSLAVVSEDRVAAEARRKALFRRDPVLPVTVNGSVVAVKGGQVTPLIAKDNHLSEPAGLAVAADGTIYVSNCGNLNNVSVFDAKGAYQRSIGLNGGRPRMGKYDPAGMFRPAGISLDTKGRLWVAENTPIVKRVSVWDPATGKLDREFFGGTAYSTHVYIDPEFPDEAFCEGVIYSIDWQNNTWAPKTIIWKGYPHLDHDSPDAYGGGYGGFRSIRAKNGHQYGWAIGSLVTLYHKEGDIYRPIMGTFPCHFQNEYIAWPPFPFMNDKQKFPEGWYTWVDQNNDGTIQENEVAFYDKIDNGVGWGWIDQDLNLYAGAGYIYRPLSIDGNGIPKYDLKKYDKLPIRGNNGQTSLILDREDRSIYINAPDHSPGYARYTPDGKTMIWGHNGAINWPRAMDKPPGEPGKLWGPTAQLGNAGNYTGISMYFGTFHVYTRDEGLPVAMLFRDQRAGAGLGPDVNACETFAAQLLQPKGTNRYLFLSGDQDGRVSEVLGLETVKKLPGGQFTITEEQAKQASDALAEYERLKAKSQRLDLARGKDSLSITRGVSKYIDSNRSFTVKAAYDDQNLYVRYEVMCPIPLVNGAPDPKTIFKGGNLIDIQIAADPDAPADRKTPTHGDVRVLVTRQQDKPTAMVFRPKVKGFSGEPTVLISPTGKESFDVIERTDRVQLDYTQGEGNFAALVTIPRDLIGLNLKPGTTVKMDVGYIFGNPPGTLVTHRAYWSNNSFAANVTNDVPHESRLEPKEWGNAGVE